jgi:hypothetical protein
MLVCGVSAHLALGFEKESADVWGVYLALRG